MSSPALIVEPLTPGAFAPFGEVIEPAAAKQVYAINEGTAQRFHDLANLDCTPQGGRTIVSLFRAAPRELPFTVRMMERHPLGSQAFVPLDPKPRRGRSSPTRGAASICIAAPGIIR